MFTRPRFEPANSVFAPKPKVRVESEEFLLKQEFLAIMLGVQRPTATWVIGKLQQLGVIRSGMDTFACSKEADPKLPHAHVTRSFAATSSGSA